MAFRVLRCRELLDEIFSYFAVQPTSTGDYDEKAATKNKWNATLIDAALAGRALYEPALDVLWSHLDHLDPLLLVLGVWKRRDPKPLRKKRKTLVAVCPIYVMRDGFCPDRFARFQHHARRILSTNGLNRSPVDILVWRALSAANGGKPLLPRLRRAVWYVDSAFDVDLLLLIPRTLRYLDVQHWDEVYGPQFEMSTKTKCKYKRILTARDQLTDYMLVRIQEAAPDLTQIRICTPRFESLVVLSWCRSLAHLTLKTRREFALPGGDYKAPFLVLQSLDVSAPVGSVKALLASLRCPKLRHVSLRPHNPCTLDDLKGCLMILVDTFGDILEGVAVAAWPQTSREQRSKVAVPFAAAVLSVLSRMQSLRSVALSGATAFWTSGFALDGILKAWPALRSLKITLLSELPSDYPRYLPIPVPTITDDDLMSLPAPTIPGLLEISKLCSDLRVLELPVVDALYLPSARAAVRLKLDHVKFRTVRRRKSVCDDCVWDALDDICLDTEVAHWLYLLDELIEDVPNTGREPFALITVN
ncbi:uncharacterized protein B0H18DRAFT_1106892 [Fomitopsis serialis]|uniref:uncharacterized protein n=1 Tax=Fomitopsis serialis TaxID=139415 RepID=UPI0020085F55|nr:uncharacterized protein B0H18DRAFT_1106892 [Neoantrodia serialis]KAH9918599.1 hypothetical protein B0H18DRAFT_1106892 [Neoantrodia serialis]